ncbi:MAG: alpha/beta hydrolase [Planctomycetaceae bacterium]|nr:alpha/beta hydrolase [Planctomycetaceae bacterium]
MIRRILCIGLAVATKGAVFTGRLAGQEPGDASPSAVPVPTLGGKQFWADQLFFHQWRIQHNTFTGHCRLLDENNFRHAWGAYDDCYAVLQRIKRERKLPPMSGKAVVVLHGLMRSRACMDSLCHYLRDQGGYQVFNVEYPSTQYEIADHAKSLRHIIDHLDGIDEINFVGHSMGNIVIRHYLGDLAHSDPLKQPSRVASLDRHAKARFGRFVMLGPPNQGAVLAKMFADNVLFKGFTGDAGQQLGREWPYLQKRLATPDFQFGIVAGGRGDNKGYNPLLHGDNDGVVDVASAKLPGAADFTVVPVVHSLMMDSRQVQQYVLRFLQHGYFISQQERRPLEKKP